MTKTTEEAGPYTIILATDFHREAGFFGCYVIRDGLPVISHPLAKPFAEEYRDELNSAWLAGRSSVTAQVGEPVAWRSFRRHYMRISYPLHNAFAILGYDTLGDIIDHLGVKITDDHDANYFRLKKALMKMRGIGQLRATDGASAIMEIIERATPSAVPLSPEMVEKLINLIYTWMVDSAAEETGVTMEQFMTEIKSTPRVIKADSDLRTRLLGIR